MVLVVGITAQWSDLIDSCPEVKISSYSGILISSSLHSILKEGDVITVRYKGVYVIVNNGYLAWSCTLLPATQTKYDGLKSFSPCRKMWSAPVEI